MARHRWIFLLPLSFIFYLLLAFWAGSFLRDPIWWKIYMDVPTQLATPDEPSLLPPIVILNDATVAFEELRFDWKDHDLDQLSLRLRALAPTIGPNDVLQIHPSPESRYERIIQVLSAVRRAGIYHYRFL